MFDMYDRLTRPNFVTIETILVQLYLIEVLSLLHLQSYFPVEWGADLSPFSKPILKSSRLHAKLLGRDKKHI